MPVRLGNGVVVYNATPHPLHFWVGGDKIITAESDVVINAHITSDVIEARNKYTLVELRYEPTDEGEWIIDSILEECPEALIVGSAVAAQAYPGRVVSPIPNKSLKHEGQRVIRSNRFNVYRKATNNGSSKEGL